MNEPGTNYVVQNLCNDKKNLTQEFYQQLDKTSKERPMDISSI